MMGAATRTTARKTRSSSKEIGPSRNFRTSSNRNKEIARDTVMCFVKVSTVNVNARINNTTQRMIGGKDDAGLTCCTGSVVEQRNLVTLGGAEVLSLTAVNMTNMSISGVNLLHELLAQLVCQQDTRSNHNNGLRTVSEQTQRVTDHDKGLATASRHDDLTLAVPCHGVQRTLLVRAKGEGQGRLVSIHVLYTKKPPGARGWTVLKLSQGITLPDHVLMHMPQFPTVHPYILY